ncbi:MAG: hypothetical protein C4K58_00210 [Flavobacteriaceae bacterium]|nr:MAG: hypothetical protein C4K58_00210 [Flavobacteriaceae bacterium]
MKQLQLSPFVQLSGIGATSGLYFQDYTLFVIGDNSSYLYQYSLESQNLTKIPLVENAIENIAKKEKLDLEAITSEGKNLYIFGSGSTQKRNQMFEVDIVSKEVKKQVDLTEFYQTLQNKAKLEPQEFNLEGVIFDGKVWYLFNRGNGKQGKNLLFSIQNELSTSSHIDVQEFQLPEIQGVVSSFTDSILLGQHIYFLAAAENTSSTYDDGEVLGTLLGRICLENQKIDFTEIVSFKNKFEGISFYQKSENQIEFLLCEDNDTESHETTIYKVVLSDF